MTTQFVSRAIPAKQPLEHFYRQTRADSLKICQPLAIEDFGIQTMADVSPPKWHLAHTSWFFETFILTPFASDYHEFHPRYGHLFNSYYEQVGTFHPRPERGLLSRPTVEEVFQYRQHIDQAMVDLLASHSHVQRDEIVRRTLIGLHHEQQHQELLLTDIKHIFAYNPLKPVYHSPIIPISSQSQAIFWHEQPQGIYRIGHRSLTEFAYDNESPCHKVYLEPFSIASRLVNNEEYLEFVDAGGYQQPQYWLSDGWKIVHTQQWQAPLYWECIDNQWYEMTLAGFKPLDRHAPVCHVSLYEAHAFASWKQKRLPTEQEWEVVAGEIPIEGNLRDTGYLQPIGGSAAGLDQFYGDTWEWTQSSYSPYPGYRAAEGALGEYNGKFMCSQVVLRGGSCVTPQNHIRSTYRNFFYPKDRWQFSGIRLAESV